MESALEMVLSTAAALSGLVEVHLGAGRSGKQRGNNTRRPQALKIIANRVFLSALKNFIINKNHLFDHIFSIN